MPQELRGRVAVKCGMVDAMTLILRLPCNSCAKRHDFCFSDETTVQPGAFYGYVCSDTKKAASFMAPDLMSTARTSPTARVAQLKSDAFKLVFNLRQSAGVASGS